VEREGGEGRERNICLNQSINQSINLFGEILSSGYAPEHTADVGFQV